MKNISTVPLRKITKATVSKVTRFIKYTSFRWYISVFVYANILLYFLYMIKKIFL